MPLLSSFYQEIDNPKESVYDYAKDFYQIKLFFNEIITAGK